MSSPLAAGGTATGYWPAGIPRHLTYPAVSVGELLAAVCRRFAGQVAVVDGEERLTFGQLAAQASALAHALRADGVGPGSTVVTHLPNSRWFVVVYVATQFAGAALSPANPLHTRDGLRHQLLEAHASVVVSHPDHAATAVEASEGTGVRRVVVVPPSAVAPATRQAPDRVTPLADYVAGKPSEPPVVVGAGPDDVAHLAFTGGTTGVSKAVRVLHRNVVANVCQALAWRSGALLGLDGQGELTITSLGLPDTGLREGRDVTIIVGPMYHAHALINTLFLLAYGATVVILGRFGPQRLLAAIEEHRATYLTGSPSMWHALINCPDARTRDLTSLRVVASGAAPIDGETMRALAGIFPSAMVNEGYGLTEGTCIVASTPALFSARRKQGSVGQPIPDTELQIRGPGGERLGPDTPGEIWIRGPQVTGGYEGHDELTAEQYVDGWLRTGDVGYVDDEGFVFISDRLKDMLIYNGYNVYPRELEELLVAHPAVSAAAVVGRDDPAVGQIPVAFVVPAEGATADPGELMAYVAERVLHYKKIREMHVVPALPTSAAGKVLKAELRRDL